MLWGYTEFDGPMAYKVAFETQKMPEPVAEMLPLLGLGLEGTIWEPQIALRPGGRGTDRVRFLWELVQRRWQF